MPLQVKIITPHLACGNEVTIDLEPTATKDEIKLKLVDATGVPFEHQKVLLSGINQIALGDKRCESGSNEADVERGWWWSCNMNFDSPAQ